jgi:hypothetical protein
VAIFQSLISWDGAFVTVVSSSQPLGSDSRRTLCQALASFWLSVV